MGWTLAAVWLSVTTKGSEAGSEKRMTEITKEVRCGDCGASLAEDGDVQDVCPNCGSDKQNITLNISEQTNVKVRDQLRAKVKDSTRTGKKKLRVDLFHGFDVRVSKGDYVHKERVLDKDNDLYVERVVEEDGTIIRDIREPLTEHTGHGSAKFKGDADDEAR